ncbi:MAG: hypothetical protein QNK37_16605 [Acidobacteriota bacterium]|nr:hypothetical protein [Acidobacteriota bacterium]
MVHGQTISSTEATYDLILENGRHVLAVPMIGEPGGFYEGERVVHALRLRFPYRVPYLGPVLRNFWAKSRGARLYAQESAVGNERKR